MSKNDCENCGGLGYTYHDYADHNGEHKEHKLPCGECNAPRDEDDYDEDEDY